MVLSCAVAVLVGQSRIHPRAAPRSELCQAASAHRPQSATRGPGPAAKSRINKRNNASRAGCGRAGGFLDDVDRGRRNERRSLTLALGAIRGARRCESAARPRALRHEIGGRCCRSEGLRRTIGEAYGQGRCLKRPWHLPDWRSVTLFSSIETTLRPLWELAPRRPSECSSAYAHGHRACYL
jgi:hypothetical protein